MMENGEDDDEIDLTMMVVGGERERGGGRWCGFIEIWVGVLD